MNEIDNLRHRINDLEKENLFLKSLLDDAGISYAQKMLSDSTTEIIAFDPNQGDRIIPTEITHNRVRRFFSYFWGRMDVFGKRHRNRNTEKVGYYPQCDNFWRRGICPKVTEKNIQCRDCTYRVWTKLEASHIEAHLRGNKDDASDVIGVYPLFTDGTCRFLVFDFDNHDKNAELTDFANEDDLWIDEVNAMRDICRLNSIPSIVERSRSGKGAHIWIFFDGPIEASTARKFGFSLLDKGAEYINLKTFRFYDRMLPAQDMVLEGEVGNLIALPLQGQALKFGNSAFIDSNWNAYPNQWDALLSTKRLTKGQIEKYISDWSSSEIDSELNALFELQNDGEKPWERTNKFHREDVTGKVQIILSNQIYVQTSNLKPRIQNQIRRLAAFSNPKYYKNNSMGLSNYAESRIIYLGKDDNGYICIPRGLLDTLKDKCNAKGIETVIEDKRSSGRTIRTEFIGELRDNQKQALDELLKHECGILSAATAFGKTVTCSAIVSEKKVSTLIILESSSLVEQWEKAVSTFLRIDEDLPEYQTKTGLIRKRKSVIGIIQGAKDTSTGIIDIAMAGSMYKNGEFHPRLKDYGLVIVDECHHSASNTVSMILHEVTAKYVYGVTATPFRGDGLEKINYMLLGPVRFQYSAKQKAAEQGISHYVIPRFTRVVSPHAKDRLNVNESYELLRDSYIRNEQISEDIKSCVMEGRTPVVLTRYTDHASNLYEKVKSYADNVFLLTGKKSKKEQRELRKEMDNVPDNESIILIATGQLIGEGFDFPRLDTLIMATPVAWKGVVEQYAGRLNRDYEGKKNVMIYDYVDCNIPVFDNMYAKRLKAYKRIGYKIFTDIDSSKRRVNAIYDSETYYPVFEKDLQEAVSEIVISSPTLGKHKVFRIIRLLKERQENGVKITIVTWHPDAYKYGRDEYRIELMESLRNSGFHIELIEEDCKHFAVMDNEVVWYGNMNILSRDDVDDNIMRVNSKEIASELLEMTFRKGNNLQEYSLPICSI